MPLNLAYFMLFIDLTMSLILAQKHVVLLMEISMQVGGAGSFLKQCLTEQVYD